MSQQRNPLPLPDRWEKKHHLSLKVKQAKRDQDRDGLRNKAEYKAGFDPRDDDSDDDDGDRVRHRRGRRACRPRPRR